MLHPASRSHESRQTSHPTPHPHTALEIQSRVCKSNKQCQCPNPVACCVSVIVPALPPRTSGTSHVFRVGPHADPVSLTLHDVSSS
jgi:hypothetical protein